MDDFYVTEAMIEYGGNFVKRLAMAYRAADPENQARIKTAWPEYWEKYRGIAEMKEQQ